MEVGGYTPRELARAAGFELRSVPTGGVVLREYSFGQVLCRVLEIGPDATDGEIVRHACRFLVFPRSVRTPHMTLASAV